MHTYFLYTQSEEQAARAIVEQINAAYASSKLPGQQTRKHVDLLESNNGKGYAIKCTAHTCQVVADREPAALPTDFLVAPEPEFLENNDV